MIINTTNNFVTSLLQNVETEQDVKDIVDSIVRNTELDKKEVLAILEGQVVVNDTDLLKDIVQAVHQVTPFTESDVEDIFYNASEVREDALQALLENEEETDDEEEDEVDDEEEEESDDEEELDTEDLLDIQEKIVSTFSQTSKKLDQRLNALENEKLVLRFYNKIVNLKTRFDSIKNMPQVAGKILFGKNLNLQQLSKEVIKNAKLSGVSPETYLYGLESIVQFCETISPVIKFAQIYAVPDEEDIEQLKEIVRFSQSMSKRDEQFLSKLGFDEESMKRKFR